MEEITLSMEKRRKVTLCNHNFSEEGIYHPDRVMTEYDLLYMQNGEWDIMEEDACYHVAPGHVLLLEPGKRHYSLNKCSPMMRNVYIHFSEEEILSSTQTLTIAKLTDCTDNHEILHDMERIIDVYFSANYENRELRLSILLDELLVALSDINRSKEKEHDIWIQEIIHRIHCNPERFFSPKELADSYHVSERTLSRRFKAETGQSVHQYQLKYKLQTAYDVLPHSLNRPLRDIAKSYGFYDEFQFSKLFKREFGIAPSKRR